ncbi:MAG: type II toxin-antitoxin system YafQ family toxin [Paludibacteraceae bacterium]|nr:type II toxin-antitoxin system YafQ family toxin [Paludibacteraceae bacterium]
MYLIKATKNFEKDLKRCKKRGYDMQLIAGVINILKEKGSLPLKFKPHKLSGIYSGLWECHITSDWLLLWQQNDNELVLIFTDTGTHSDLF